VYPINVETIFVASPRPGSHSLALM